MTNKSKFLTMFVVLAVAGCFAPPPELELPNAASHCVENTAYMRSHHMKLLEKWRTAVVREGQQTYTSQSFHQNYTMSLTKTCMGCHIDRQTFCDRCHTYASVRMNCWNCHTNE